MASISRRTFLKQSGSGVAAAGFFAAIPSLPSRVPGSRRAAVVHDTGVAAPVGRGAERATRRAHP